MKIEKLTEEMTEKIVGGSKREVKTITRKLIERPEVECIACGERFRLTVTYNRPKHMSTLDFLIVQQIHRTCPYCNFVNSQYVVFREK